MNVSATSSQDIFDVRKIRRLVELMKEHDLCEIDLQQGEVRIQLRRAGTGVQPVLLSAPQLAAPATVGPPAPESVAPAAATAKLDNTTVIKSPMVGTFYRASGPDAAAFVKVGDRIGPEKTVCIVEAMKVFNEIPAGVSGQVVAILVENGAPIEFGQPLIKVDPEA
jgi:acetyl-CoA carboxylase biotin carboxyl carrier protein